MGDMPVTALRFGAKARSEPYGRPHGSKACPTEASRAPKQLQDLLDDDGTPPTLKERLENWGSD